MLALYCHTLELALKAYLRQRGVSIKELVELGHNLQKILTEAERHDFGKFCKVSDSLRVAARVMTPLLTGRHLHYPYQGFSEILMPETLAQICRELLANVRRYCVGDRR